jgi:predicted nuclease of predicted toxin-antitoxin system
MKLLLDQGLPRSTVLHLRNQQIEAVHVGDRGLATATDSKILDVGRQEGMVLSHWMLTSTRCWPCRALPGHL